MFKDKMNMMKKIYLKINNKMKIQRFLIRISLTDFGFYKSSFKILMKLKWDLKIIKALVKKIKTINLKSVKH
jgi:EAL domain-containing protein (putative c-di-GMP-specific phosphodiesterase class I)